MMLITGGAGYIGSHLTDALIEDGYDVTVIDDLSSGNYINEKAKLIKFDLRDGSQLKVDDVDVIFHLAANPDVRTSMIDSIDHFERDVKVTFNLLEIARKIDAKKVIFASSSTVYGEGRIPTPEWSEIKPISNYGLFKVLGEDMLKYYSRNYSIKGISVRFANVTGGRVSHGVVKDFIEKLKRDSSKLEILGNGRQRKSYIYIEDAVKSLTFLADYYNGNYEEFNVGNEDWITVNEIAEIIEKEMGIKPIHVYKDELEGRGWMGDVRFMLLDCMKIISLGWRPKFTSKETVRLAARDLLYGYRKRKD
jgi:UDP-glucose 4-epimerase